MSFTRRSTLALLASVPFVASSDAQAAPIRVGFVPVIGAASLFVVDGAGWAKSAGLALSMTKFDSGPAAVQAFASGTFDALFIGVAPVAVARAKGLDASVIAAAGSGGSSFIATPELAARFDAHGKAPAAALAAFRKETGRRAKLATLPPGGVPNVTLNHWLFETGKTDRADVELAFIGIEAIQQAMLAGAIDGATVLEPAATIVQMRNPALKRVVDALDMFPEIPGVVLAISRRFIAARRSAAVDLVRLHARATMLILEKPEEAAPHVAAVLGGGLVEPAVMARAMRSKAIAFVADPRAIVEPTKRMLAYQASLGDFPQAPPTDGLFDLSLWDEAKA